MIEVKNITKSFGSIKALRDVSFTIKPGEIVGFLGPNGAGKTTAMRIITGFLLPDKGKVVIDDVNVNINSKEAQRNIGYLPENNPLYKEMLVSEFLNLSAELQNVPKNKKRSALDFVVKSAGIKTVFYRPIGELSKGFKQRVGLAAALLHNPKIIIMDEPTEGLDPNQRKEIRKLIKKLAEKHTIILSTHVMQEASAVCNRLLVVNKGKIVADGTTEELSRAGQNERILHLEIEGDNTASLRDLKGAPKLEILKKNGRRVSLKLTAEKDVEVRPEISKLASRYKWVIWKLAEEERQLEDVFQRLTK